MADIDTPLAVKDNIHLDPNKLLGYNKIDTAWITTRGMGKSTVLTDLMYSQYKKGRTNILVRNQTVDITDAYINDIETNLNLFRKPSEYGKISHKGSLEKGVVDLYWEEGGVKGWIARVIALSIKVTRYKSLTVPKVGWMIIDECIPNLRIGEKWLPKYTWRINELYSTFARYAWLTEKRTLRKLWAGNPYSRYLPYFFETYKLDTMKLQPGATVVGKDYAISLETPSKELQEWLQHANPSLLNDINKEWQDFMSGSFVNDDHYIIEKTQPKNYKLRWVFRFGGTYLGIFRHIVDNPNPIYYDNFYDRQEPYWICVLDDYQSKYRDVLCFDLNDLVEGSIYALKDDKSRLQFLKNAIARRQCSFKDVNAASIMEQVFLNL